MRIPPAAGSRPRPRCAERTCLYHDGERCTFPWIEPPAPEEMDRGACRTYVLVEGDEYVVRMSAIF